MKQEGNVDFRNGTPLELADGKPGTPVSFWRTSWNPFTRWKYGCMIHRRGAADQIAWFDANGVPMSTNYRVRNVTKQSTWICNDTVFWHRQEAINCATSNGLPEPMKVVEIVTGENGKVLSRDVLELV